MYKTPVIPGLFHAQDSYTFLMKELEKVDEKMASIKETLTLCTVATPVWVYEDMLLTDLSVVEDETCPDGWTGSLTFTHTDPPTANVKTNDNSSTRNSSGQTGAEWIVGAGGSVDAEASLEAFRVLLRAAGIKDV